MKFKRLDKKLHRRTVDEILARRARALERAMEMQRWTMEIIAEAIKIGG